MNKLIDSFSGDYDFLSNFYNFTINYEGVTYQNTEAAFQASKIYLPDREKTMELRSAYSNVTPSVAKKMGRKGMLRDDWEEVKDSIMLNILRIKFKNSELRKKLLATGDAVLVEGNTWHDCYWGDCSCPRCAHKSSKNMLGKLLMQVRKEILDEIIK